jgi:prepilin-type N-terminal cleavage/methylation domain-containing protein
MNQTMNTSQAQQGFTLIEVLLAAFVTSFVMLAVGSTFNVTLEARAVVDELSESTAAGPRILSLIERDLRGMWTYNIKENRVLHGSNGDVGSFEADRLNLLTTTDSIGYVLNDRSEPVYPTLCEVGYWLKPNPRYRDLIELWRREDPLVDDNLQTEGRFQLVHDRIKSFKISYYRTLGYESEELSEWDSSTEDRLPRRIKIEFTLERKRGSRNIVADAEVADFEGAEKTYTRHFVLDQHLDRVLRAQTALIPVRPTAPQVAAQAPQGAGGPMAPGGAGGAFGGTEIARGEAGRPAFPGAIGDGKGDSRGSRGGDGGRGTFSAPGSGGGRPPINFEELIRGLGGSGGGLGGLFGNR